MTTSIENKAAEARSGDVVVEIWQKDREDNKTYFDVICKVEEIKAEGRQLSTLLPVSALPSLVIAVVRAMEFISVSHREIRQSESAVWQFEPITDVVTAWVKPYKEFSDDEISSHRQLHEIKCGAVVTELCAKGDDLFLRCRREFPSGGQWRRSPFIQQRDLRDLIISVTEMWKRQVSLGEGNRSGASGGFHQE